MKIVYFCLAALITIAFFPSLSKGQFASVTPDVRAQKPSCVTRKPAWVVPSLVKMKPSATNESSTFGGMNVFIRDYVPIRPMDGDLPSFFSNDDALSIIVNMMTVTAATTYSLDSRVFLIKVLYSPIYISGGIRRVQGAVISKSYFDRDGDGKFETMCNANEDIAVVPDWVTKAAR
jgi:hypothetical protein